MVPPASKAQNKGLLVAGSGDAEACRIWQGAHILRLHDIMTCAEARVQMKLLGHVHQTGTPVFASCSTYDDSLMTSWLMLPGKGE
jgi:hypothetical protein